MQGIYKWVYRIYMTLLIQIYFFYQDIKGKFVIALKGETLSDDIIREVKGNVFCIFVLYQKYDIPNNVLNLLKKLTDKDVNVIIVSNMEVSSERKAQLDPFIHRLIVRRNIGRDFGAYKHGVLALLNSKHYNPERLLLLNDSVFYRNEGLDFFIGEMLSDHEFIGVAENYEFHYHVGSYALAMGPKIIKDKRFKEYWEKYKLTEVRPKVIKRGEVGLNKLIIDHIAIKPHVIYSLRKLHSAIKNEDMRNLIAGYNSMPSRFMANHEDSVYDRLALVTQHWNVTPDEDVLKSGLANRTGELIGYSKGEMFSMVKAFQKLLLEKELIDFTVQGSQIHWAGALLVNYLNCPLIKNDMVVRLIYSPAELQIFAKFMSAEEYEEFFYFQIYRGIPTIHWKGFKRAMLMLGYV